MAFGIIDDKQSMTRVFRNVQDVQSSACGKYITQVSTSCSTRSLVAAKSLHEDGRQAKSSFQVLSVQDACKQLACTKSALDKTADNSNNHWKLATAMVSLLLLSFLPFSHRWCDATIITVGAPSLWQHSDSMHHQCCQPLK
eukprot:1161464-Pelagomonas_calceolata.AAC.9